MKKIITYNQFITNESSYNETIKGDIELILLGLKDTKKFDNFVVIIDKFCSVRITSLSKFDYSGIKEEVERIIDYMTENNFYIYDFSHFLDRSGYKKPEIKYVINNRDKLYYFEIDFKSLGDVNKTNEELKSEVYLSAADKLAKMGHTKRPEELKKWSGVVRQRELAQKAKENLEEAKKFSKPINFKSSFIEAPFYPVLQWNQDGFYETSHDWLRGDANLWLEFSLGIITDDEVVNQKMTEKMDKPYNGIYWIGSVWIHLNDSLGEEEQREEKKKTMTFSPDSRCDISDWEWSWSIDRKSAINFKNFLLNVFSSHGDTYRETSKYPGGILGQLQEVLCSDLLYDHNSFLDFLESIKKININSLYKD